MILPNSLRWVAKITCSSEEVSKKCEEEKPKTNSGQTNQWPHFHVIIRSHIPKQFLKIFIATADDQACVKQWRLVGRAQNNYVLSWINFKALAPEWVWDAQRFGIVDSLSERPQEPRSASIEWCGFPYNRKSLNFWKLVFQWSDIHVQPMKMAFMLLMPCQPQLNLDYLDSLGPHEIVRIIEGLDSGKCEYWWRAKPGKTD